MSIYKPFHSTVLTVLRLLGVAIAASTAQAALIDEGNGQLYDNVTGLVWLQNANLAASNTFGISRIADDTPNTYGVSGIYGNGSMNWSTAQSWIAAMNGAAYLGHNDWRLPILHPINGTSINSTYSPAGTTDAGYNIASPTSELSYMYYVNLGLKGAYSPSGSTQFDFGLFGDGTYAGQTDVGLVKNLQPNWYWYDTETVPNLAAWVFSDVIGMQNVDYEYNRFVAWAVRPADVTDLPEPATLVLLALGVVGLGFSRDRKSIQD